MKAESEQLLLRIRGLLPALNEQEQKVGQYILEQPEASIHLTVSELAARAGASDTTVSRFARRVGAEGYTELRIRLAQELAQARTPSYVPVFPADSTAEAARKVIEADVKALEDTLRVLDMERLDAAADVLLAARRVDIYGSGGGAVAALEMQYKLMRVGVRAVPHIDSEMQAVSATLLTPSDAAVAISHSGQSPDVLHAILIAQRSGARTIAITNHPESAVARAVEFSLCTAAQEALASGYPLGARVAQVVLIDILFAFMHLKRQEETDRSLDRIGEALLRQQG
jgi:RpiR family transcriptional regulator, carbohydrate utilization regulator